MGKRNRGAGVMSSKDGIWPWGECEHEIRGTARKWCGCGEWCSDPAEEAREMMRRADAYWMLCRCCREPLYQLRIAELEGELQATRRRAEAAEEDWQATEAELAKFHECPNLPPSHNHITGRVDASGHMTYESHTIYHKED